MAPRGKKITLDDGRTAYEYPDGSIRNASGSYAVAPPWKHRDFTVADAERRHEIARQAAVEGIKEASGKPTEAEAAKQTTKLTYEILEGNNGTAGVQAAKLLWRMAGWLQDRQASAGLVQQIVSLDASALEYLTRRRAETEADDSG